MVAALPLIVHWHVSPVLFHIGKFPLRWYSLLFIAGFFIGWHLFQWFFRREKVPEKLLEPLLWTLVIATMVGARLGHVLFYAPQEYFGSWQGFLEIFMPWKGGLASHGGAIALILSIWWFARRYGREGHFDFLWLLDRLVVAACFAGACIRIGNLFNSEIYGDVTTLPWGFVFELRGETEPKHPTQLYEAFSYLILGLALVLLYRDRLPRLHRGMLAGIGITGIFVARFLIEFIKEPQVEFESSMPLDMGQLLSIPFILVGLGLIIRSAATAPRA